jgi:hypothetical protein
VATRLPGRKEGRVKHDIASISDGENNTVILLCTCGHPVRSPNEDTARKRHGIHADAISVARAALEAAK